MLGTHELIAIRKAQRKGVAPDYAALWDAVYSASYGLPTVDALHDVAAFMERPDRHPLLAAVLYRSSPDLAFKAISAMPYTLERTFRYVYKFARHGVSVNGTAAASVDDLLECLSGYTRYEVSGHTDRAGRHLYLHAGDSAPLACLPRPWPRTQVAAAARLSQKGG